MHEWSPQNLISFPFCFPLFAYKGESHVPEPRASTKVNSNLLKLVLIKSLQHLTFFIQALFWAVNSNSVDVVEYLLEQGVESNLTDVRNDTPLDIALNNNFEQIANLLSKDDMDSPDYILSCYPNEYDEVVSLKDNER